MCLFVEQPTIANPPGMETTQEEGLSHLDFALCGVQTPLSMERKKKKNGK